MALLEALQRLEVILRGLGTPAAEALRPGIPASEVESQLAQIGLHPPEDLVTWYGWHDGLAVPRGGQGQPELVPGWWFGSLQDMSDMYRDDVQWALEEYGSHGVEWFPVLASVWGDSHVMMRCDAEAPGQIAHTVNVAFAPEFNYWPRSLAEPVSWWADLLAAGRYDYDVSTERFKPLASEDDIPQDMVRSNLL